MTSRTITILLLIVAPSILWSALFISVFLLENDILTGAIAILLLVPLYGIAYFWYIPYHTKDKPEKYFKKIGMVEAVKEYQFSMKLFRVTTAITIFLFIYILLAVAGLLRFFVEEYIRFGPAEYDEFVLVASEIWILLVTILSLPIVVLAIRFGLLHIARKDFDFHLAKAYFMVGSQKDNELEKFKYLIIVLDAYNKFLERNLKLEIKDIIRIYSIIISASAEQLIMIRESIGKALEKDKLELARRLAELSSLPDEEHFLTKESLLLNQQFKDVLTVIIPTAISVVTFIIATLTQVGIVGSSP